MGVFHHKVRKDHKDKLYNDIKSFVLFVAFVVSY